MKPLTLSHESSSLTWRTEEDKKFMQSAGWKKIRSQILVRDNNTCQYCEYSSEKGMSVHHIDGDPRNHDLDNLETICPHCHMIMHSGLWCQKKKVIKLYSESRYPQNQIIRISWEMRKYGKSDEEIIAYLGLIEETLPWMPDLEYLSQIFGFIPSKENYFNNEKKV